MALMQWSDRLSVGVKEFDDHHKKIVALINDMYDAMMKGEGKEKMGKVLTELVGYVGTHFAAEERTFKTHGYPDVAAHKVEHDKLTKQVIDFGNQFKSGKAVVSNELMTFLKDWLMTHIMGTDKKYTKFLNEKGVK